MTDIYVRSTDGNNSDSGLTWALAKATLTGGASIEVPGDNIYVSQAHSESTAANIAINAGNNFGPLSSPVKIIGVNDGAEPPTALSTAPQIATTGASTITIVGHFYMEGINFSAGSGSSLSHFSMMFDNGATGLELFKNCNFVLASTNASNRVEVGSDSNGSASQFVFENVTVTFSDVAQRILLNRVDLRWVGGAYAGVAATGLFAVGSGVARVVADSVDLSALATSCSLVDAIGGATGRVAFRGCKLPAGWSGTLGTPLVPNSRFSVHDCYSTTVKYRIYVSDYAGTIREETVIVPASSATDGVADITWKMASNANCSFPNAPLVTDEIYQWNEDTAAAKTATIQIVTDGVTLKESECWIEVGYANGSSDTLSSRASDGESEVLTGMSGGSASQATSTETWTTTGLSSPIKQKLAATFTPQQKGWLIVRAYLAKPSTTVYVNPRVTLS